MRAVKGDAGMETIYLAEDEPALRELLSAYLREAGFQVKTFSDGITARGAIADAPDLWVLDIMLPGVDGYALLKAIKEETPKVPVVFSSARSAELDRVVGLEMGSEDYLPKPFLPRELVIRVKRILDKQGRPMPPEDPVPAGPYLFNRSSRSVSIRGEEIQLTNKEFELLDFLMQHVERALSRNQLIEAVWGIDYYGSDRVVDDTIRRLRKKMPLIGIEPVYGYGYVLKEGSR